MLLYLIACVLVVVVLYRIKAKPVAYPCKGVTYHPFIGNFFTLQLAQVNLSPQIYKWCKANDFKSFELTMPTLNFFFLQSPKDVQCFLKDNWESFAKNHDGVGFEAVYEELLGKGIFAVDGETWRFHRKAASRLFSANSLKNRMHSVFLEHAHKACAFLRANVGKEVDLQLLFANLTFDTMSEIAFGSNVHALDSHTKPAFLEDFDALQILCTGRFLTPPFVWKAQRMANIGSEKEIAERTPRLKAYVMKIIAQRQQENDLEDRGDLLSMFIVHSKKSGGGEPTDQMLCDVVLNFMIAGRDTTAALLTNFFALISLNPESRRRFTDESKECVYDGIVSFDALKNASFSLACMRETLRLYPSVGSDSRFCVKDITLPSGAKVKRGTSVSLPMFAMGRNPNIWGDDALEFNPDRFLNKQPNDWEWPVFWGGPRLCLGKGMAQIEFQSVAAMIASQFEFDIPEVNCRDHFVSGPVLFRTDGLMGTPRAI